MTYLSRAAVLGEREFFLLSVKQLLQNGNSDRKILFAVGKALRGNINVVKKEIFGNPLYFETIKEFSIKSFMFFHSQCLACRAAIDTWTIIAIRSMVVKDIRRMISEMLWKDRAEARYTIK